MRVGRLLMQILEGVLVLALFRALFTLREPNVPRIPFIIGITMNLSLQWLMITALRKQKNIERLSSAERNNVSNRQRAMLKPLLLGCFSLFIILMVNVALFVSHTYSARPFAFVTVIAAALTFVFLVVRFAQLKRLQG
jgi:hypothetical protein